MTHQQHSLTAPLILQVQHEEERRYCRFLIDAPIPLAGYIFDGVADLFENIVHASIQVHGF